ncbi:MAG: hypothetical protein WCE44_06445, partial [Candidatus Velthaea sp.]
MAQYKMRNSQRTRKSSVYGLVRMLRHHELRHPTRKRVWDGVSGQFLAKIAQRPPQVHSRAVLIAREDT